jgi:hypothetical protein
MFNGLDSFDPISFSSAQPYVFTSAFLGYDSAINLIYFSWLKDQLNFTHCLAQSLLIGTINSTINKKIKEA